MTDTNVALTEGVTAQAQAGGPLPSPQSASGSGSASQPQPSPGSTLTPTATPQVAVKVSQVTDPHHAATLVKGEVSKLHTLMNNFAHYAELPFVEAEQVIANIQHLMSVIRSKV